MTTVTDVLLRQDIGEAAVKWWDGYVKQNPGLLVGCSLVQAFASGYEAGFKAGVADVFPKPMNESEMPTYEPEMRTVQKDLIYASIRDVEAGLEHARECLAVHDANLGRDIRKNKEWAETIENDIRHMEKTLNLLKKCQSLV